MSPEYLGLTMLALMVLAIMVGFPTAFTLMSLGVMFGWLPGSLAVATLATGTIFATATGIVGAAVTLLGLLAFPAMVRAGYNKRFAAGAVTASGTLGILIPPSVLLILYGFVAGVSVPRLYAGAFLPGFMLSALYFGYVVLRARFQPGVAPQLPKEQREQVSLGQFFVLVARGFVPIVSLILFVLGSI